MKQSLILVFFAILAALSIFAISFLLNVNLTGSFFPPSQEKNITRNITSEMQYKEPITTEESLQCPTSCDDYNPCTFDWCNRTSNYSCIHTNLTGDVEGCKSFISECSKRTCVSGKCTTVEIEGCLEEITKKELTQPTIVMQKVAQSKEEIQNVNETIEPGQPIAILDHIIISEIQINDNEFVELYNPTNSDVDMTGWYLSYFSSAKNWNEPYRNWQFPNNSVIPANRFYLINVFGTTSSESDWTLLTKEGNPYSIGQFSNTNGSVAIFPFDPKSKSIDEAKVGRIDAVGWGNPTYVYEGTSAPVPEKGKSLQRKSLSVDTDNNLNDFIVSDSPTPQNSLS